MVASDNDITQLDRVFHEDAAEPAESGLEVVDEAWDEEAALRNTNTLLRSVGINGKPIAKFSDLCMSASSMFVAMFEAMFQTRLGGIVRRPQHVCDYVSNAQNVIDALAGSVLDMPLAHIRGEAIVRGDSDAIINLVDIFMLISRSPGIDGSTGGGQASASATSATGLPHAHHEATKPPAPATALPAPVTAPTRAGMPAGSRPQHPLAPVAAATQPARSAAALPGPAGGLAPSVVSAWPGPASAAAPSACAPAPSKRVGPAIAVTLCTKPLRAALLRMAVAQHNRIEQQSWLSGLAATSASATGRELMPAAPAATPASEPVDSHTKGVYAPDEGRTTWRAVLGQNAWHFRGFVRDTDPVTPAPRW
jgi:hypothetical protein